MLNTQIACNISLFFCAIIGIIANRRSILDIIMCIELMLLCTNLNFLVFSIYLDDAYGLLFSLFILTIAAGEASLGLAILILLYRLKNTISATQKICIKG